MPPPTTTHYRPKYIHQHSPPTKIYPPPPTTHHQPKYIHHHLPLHKKNGPPRRECQNIFIDKLLLALLQEFLFLRNAIFFSVKEILRDKVLISSFFKFQISTYIQKRHQRCCVRIGVLRNFAIHRKAPVPEPIF